MSDSRDTPPALPKPSSGESYGWLAFLIAPALGAMLGLLLAAVLTYIMPKRYESVAVLQVNGERPVAKEILAVTSDRTLNGVVSRLDLGNRWIMDEDSVVKRLRGMLSVEQDGTIDLIRIKVRGASAEEARDIALAMAEVSKEGRENEEIENAGRALNLLDAGLRDAGGRDELNKLEEVFRLAQRQQYETDREKQQLEIQITTLERLRADELARYAAGLNLPNNQVPALYNDLVIERRELSALQASGLAAAHPKVQAVQERELRLKLEVEDAVVELRRILKTQFEVIDSRIEANNQGLESPDYLEAKRKFEEAMKLPHSSKRIALKIPKNPLTVHEHPRIGYKPVSPRAGVNLMLGIVLGGVAGLVVAVPVATVGRRKG